VTVGPDDPIYGILQKISRFRVRRLLVIAHGRVVGVIAQADLLLRQGPRDPLRVEQVLERISDPPSVPT